MSSSDTDQRAFAAAWKIVSAWDGKITKPVLRKAIAAYLREIDGEPMAWTSQYQLDDANESGIGFLYAGEWKPEKSDIPLFSRSYPRTTIPVPRGGVDTDWHAACVLLRRRFRKLEKAASAVVKATDEIHDNEPWPIKYRAPYGAITTLRETLAEVGTQYPKEPRP